MRVTATRRKRLLIALFIGVTATLTMGFSSKAKTLQYGPLPAEVGDICVPDIDLGIRPGILLIHGGGLVGGDKAFFNQRCRALAQMGFTVLNINYRLANGNRENAWPAQLQDAQLALSWMQANAAAIEFDTNRLGIIGESSGAELALFLGQQGKPGVACVIDESGPIDLTTTPSFAAELSPAIFLGTSAQEGYRAASPIFGITSKSSPVQIVHGRSDPLVPFSQAQELLTVLRKLKVPVSLLAYDGGHTTREATVAEKLRVDAAEAAYLNGCLHPQT